MRVGIISENSYWWLVYDLAMIEMRAVSVPMPETDAKASDESLFDINELNLLLVSSRYAPPDMDARPHLMRMDGDNPPGREAVRAMPARYVMQDDDHSYVVGSGTTGGRKGMIVSRRGVEAIIEEFGETFGTPPGDSILDLHAAMGASAAIVLLRRACLRHGFDRGRLRHGVPCGPRSAADGHRRPAGVLRNVSAAESMSLVFAANARARHRYGEGAAFDTAIFSRA